MHLDTNNNSYEQSKLGKMLTQARKQASVRPQRKGKENTINLEE